MGAEQNRNIQLSYEYRSAHSLQVEALADSSGRANVRLKLPVVNWRGASLQFKAMVRAVGVTAPLKPWNGIKFMLHLSGPRGHTWLQQDRVFGTFDWKVIQFKVVVPADVTNAELVLGLEEVSGRAQFDDIAITVTRVPRVRSTRPPKGPVFTGHTETRLRGVMVHPDISPQSLQLLGAKWKANLIRWQLIRNGKSAKIVTFAEYDAWLDGELRKLDAALPFCEKHGIRVLIGLHSPPGGNPSVSGYAGSNAGLFTDKSAQTKFIEVWQRMARH